MSPERRKRAALGLALTALLLAAGLTGTAAAGGPAGAGEADPGRPSLLERYVGWQRAGSAALNRSIRSLRTDFGMGKFAFLLLVSVGFGVLHSAGPGHGKALVAAFFLRREYSDLRVSNLALIVSGVHTGSAVLLALLLSTLLSSLKGMARIHMQEYFSFASGLLVFGIGLWFLYLKIRGKDLGGVREDVRTDRQLWLVGVSAGIVPCPLALMIMLITVSAGIPWIGVASVLGISFGMYLLLLLDSCIQRIGWPARHRISRGWGNQRAVLRPRRTTPGQATLLPDTVFSEA